MLGTIHSNTEEGIFGTVNERFKQTAKADAIPIGYRQDVKKGPLIYGVMFPES